MTSRGLEILSTDECLDLLRSQTLGRVAVQIGEAPAILPVNYALLDDEVVFRTDPGTKLSAAIMRTMVAFEVDDTDPVTHAGWSVLIVGYSEQIRDRATRARVDALGLEPWVTEGLDFVVHIRRGPSADADSRLAERRPSSSRRRRGACVQLGQPMACA